MRKILTIILFIFLSFCVISCKEKKSNHQDFYDVAISLGYDKTYEEFLNDIGTVSIPILKVYKTEENIIIVDLENGMSLEIGRFDDPLDDVIHSILITSRTSMLYVGDTFLVNYTTTYENPVVTFTSSDEKIASISNTGLIEAKNEGIVTITASINNGLLSDSFILAIKNKVNINVDEMKPEEDEPNLEPFTIDVSTIENGKTYTINKSGIYNIYGENQNAQILIDNQNIDVILVLNHLNLKYLGSTPTIYCKAAKSIIIKTYDNTINTISDSENNSEKAAIVVKKTNLLLKGKGTLKIEGNGQELNSSGSGIYNSKELSIYSGNYEITSNDNSIVGKDLLAINDGNFILKSNTDCLKSTDGAISIFGGTYNLDSISDGIQAETHISLNGGDFTINAQGEGIKATNEIKITDGKLNISALEDGIKANGDETLVDVTLGSIVIDGGNIEIDALGDGIQAQSSIIISGGIIKITSNNGNTGTILKDENNENISCKGIKANTSLIINDGNITINSCEDAIHSNDAIEINNGLIGIKSKYDGISSDSTLYIKNGQFNIKTGFGSTSQISAYSCKGIKASSELVINGGYFLIDSSDDNIHSNSNITINGGEFDLATADDAFHADNTLKINDGKITITKSYEGLEGSNITINGGNILVTSSDDAINAAGGMDGSGGPWGSTSSNHLISINGGMLVANSNGDGIDANGSIEITGGNVIVFGPTSGGNGSLDFDKSCTIKGGFVLICGSRDMLQTPSTTSTQYSISVTLSSVQTANKSISFTIGDKILVVTPPKKYQNVILSTPDIKSGMSILVQYNGNGTITDENFYYTDSFTATTLTTLTINSIVTTYGNGGMGGGPGGGGRPPRW